jgi:hypothetical protein
MLTCDIFICEVAMMAGFSTTGPSLGIQSLKNEKNSTCMYVRDGSTFADQSTELRPGELRSCREIEYYL